MACENKQMRSFKVKSEKEGVRRFRIPVGGDSYALLSETVMSLYKTNSVKLSYVDDEGDRVVVGSSCELEAALELMPNLVSFDLAVVEEEEAKEDQEAQEGGWGRWRGRGGRGGRKGCGGGRGKGKWWAAKIKERADDVDAKLDKVEARLAAGEQDVMLLWKKKNLEAKKAFLMERLRSIEERTEEECKRGSGMGMFMKVVDWRFELVCKKLQVLDEFLQTEEGAQHEGLLFKKQKFEKKKSCLEEKRKFMAEKRKFMEENEAGNSQMLWWLKMVEGKLENMNKKEAQDGFKSTDKFVWRRNHLEQKKLALQSMLDSKKE